MSILRSSVSLGRLSFPLLLVAVLAAPAPAEVITWHLFDETGESVSVDDSGNGQDGIVKRMADVGAIGSGRFTGGAGGKFGGGLFFDTPYGDTTYAQFVADFDISYAGSVSMFVWHDFVGYRQAYLRGGNSDFSVEMHSGNTIFSSLPGGDNFLSTGAKMTAGAWHHVVVTWDGDDGNSNCIYLNGALQRCSATRGSGPQFLGRTITIGQRLPQGSADTKRNLDGGVDDVAFYNRALTPSEIATIGTSGATAVSSGIVAFWNLDDAIGTLIAPSDAGNALDLYAGGGGTPTLVGPDLVEGQGPTLAGNGIKLDAVEFDAGKASSPPLHTRVEIPDSATMDFDKTTGSIVMWVWRSSTGYGETLFSSDDNKAQVLLRTSNSGRTIMRVNGRDVWQTNTGVDLAQVGVWDHMAFTWNAVAGSHVIYKNATIPAQQRTAGTGGPWDPSDVSDTGNWNLGFDIPERPLHGFLADFAIFDDELDADDVDYIRTYGVEGFLACGDGILDEDLGEECDDGNTDETDCCTKYCRVQVAGTCDDGLFCTTEHTCVDGVCVGSVSPCDGNPECQTFCDEDASACVNPAGDPCTDDGNLCTDDECDGAGACIHPANTLPCDDGDACTIDDTCSGGVCLGMGALDCDDGDACTADGCDSGSGCESERIPLSSACYWTVVAGDGGPGRVRTRNWNQSSIDGNVCTDIADLRGRTTGDLIASEEVSTLAARVRPGADIDGDLLTGGGAVLGRPHRTEILATGQQRILGGNVVDNLDGGVVNTEGTDPRVEACRVGKADIGVDVAQIEGLPSTANLGRVVLDGGTSRRITAPNPGGLNVLDASTIQLGNNSVLELDAAGDPQTVFILRVQGTLRGRRATTVSLIGGADPSRVVFVVGGGCRFGDNNVGAGTLACPNGAVRLDLGTRWTGALLGGRRVEIGRNVEVTHQPFFGF